MIENSPRSARQPAAFRGDLQGLRAIAVALVVLAHAGLPGLEGGFVGVDVFFVLSGYLITGILVRELDSQGGLNLLRFYARRLRRLLPALLVVLGVSIAAAVLLLSTGEAKSQLASSPYAASWTSNLFFAFRAVDYFDELAAKDLFLHTWSLGVEEQFYLVWPAYLLVLYTLGQRLGGRGKQWLLPGLLVAFAGSLVLSLYWTRTAPELAFYTMPARIWQLSLGGIICISTCDLIPGPASGSRLILARCCFVFGLLLVLGSGLVLHSHLAYPGWWALLPSLGAALLILAGVSGIAGSESPLAHPALVWLGDRSYSLYLWHWPVLILGFSLGFEGQPLAVAGLVLLALLLSMFSYRLVEYPFWKGSWSHGRPAPVVLACVVGIALSAVVTHAVVKHLPRAIPGDTSSGVRSDKPELYTMGCDDWYNDAAVKPCLFGDTDARRTAVIVGDSIGTQWFSVFPEVFAEPQWRLVVLTKSSCPIVDEPYFYARIGREYKVCELWRNRVVEHIESLQPEVVVLGNAATYPYSEAQWREGSSRIFARLSPVASAVFVIPGTPPLGFDGPGCLSRHIADKGSADDSACLAKGKAEDVAPVVGFISRAAADYDNVHVLALNDLVCPGGDCAALSPEGVPVFRDGQHLTDSFVKQKTPEIKKRMEKLFPEGLK